ncbi:probable glutamate receptor [Phymastichus coffea]|uniref:probable glutamate receptor n=1 Tax=Phymastichus coffea TaxID=108790 RepID=UPI00273AFFAB|nr:probable glutamate receptor [Phymastichus coffea]
MAKYIKYCIIIITILSIGFVQKSKQELIMDSKIYTNVVEAVHNIFNNTCVIYMYTVENPMQALNPHEAEQLMSIILYTSKLHVRSFAFAIKSFKKQIGDGYFNLKRPLFILINDSEALRQQFSKEIAPWIAMAYINWLIFFQEDTNIETFFADIYVPLDCIFLIVQKMNDTDTYTLTEVYHISKGRELISKTFGTWSENDGLSITKLALYQRRGNLHGQLIRVATVEDPPVSVIEQDMYGKMTGIRGFFGTIIQILEENLNCTVIYTPSVGWGTIQRNGSWSGIIGMLVRKEIDLAAAELLMTSDRLEAIEFTTPVFSTKCRTFIKRPLFTAVKWTAYSDPFYSSIWFSLLIIVILSSSFILIGLKNSPLLQVYNEDEESHNFFDTFFYAFGALCGQGHETSAVDSIRIINAVVHLTGVVILAAYSAALISFLAIKVFIMPFTTMDGLLEDGSYQLGTVRDSADYNFFRDSSDKTLKRMFDEIMDEEENLPNHYLEGLTKLCTNDTYAFMSTDNMFSILEHQVPCTLESLDTIMQMTAAMAVQKRSPFRGIINNNILLMGDSGVLQRVIATELVVQAAKNQENWTSVEIVDILPLIILILGGSFVSIQFLFIEKFQHSQFWHHIRDSIKIKFIRQRLVSK